MFRATREQRHPSLSQETHEYGADSDDSEAPDKDTTNYPRTQEPLTKTDLHQMLLAASADIKARTAAELERHISGLKGEIETLNNRTSKAEAAIKQIKANTTQHSQDIFYLSDKDLAPTTLRKRRDLKPLTTAVAKKGLRYRWGHPFKLQVRIGDQEHVLYHPAEMEEFAATLGLQLTTGVPARDRRNNNESREDHNQQIPRQQAKRPRPTTGTAIQVPMI
ncbi:Hypothetical predicted protein [Pelobates cultripes]|uniref:Uncharacterized protein n=1 Tax=Pelobates cultripes TaxID=61616 RepID=A0AAD1VWX3_PELCU|nr:Hypothetical predicted protein [Pelobates cultripes]